MPHTVSATPGGEQQQRWTMPSSWVGRRIGAATITPAGREEGKPRVSVHGSDLVLAVSPGRPIVLTAE